MAAESGAGPQGRAIRLLGPVDIEVDGSPLAVDTRKATALLAYVAVADRPVPRESLAAFLWPESDEPAARGALRRTLSVLNAALRGRGLRIDRASVGLADEWDVDVRRFRSALISVRGHGHATEEACQTCVASLEEAAALDRGEFMAGFSLRDSEPFDEWQLSEREAYRRDLAGVLERLARARAASGDRGAAIGAGRRWLELDPLHEPAHRLLMLVLAEAGEQAAAIRQYRDCVRILDAELGVAPLDETTELYERIRSGEVAPTAVPGAVTSVAPEEAPPGSSGAGPLVGRDAALEALVGGYRSIGPDGRLFVIEGEPGIGKTRLAGAFADAVRGLGGRVIGARAYAGESSIAFGPLGMLVAAAIERPDAGDLLASCPAYTVAAAARIAPALSTVAPATAPDGRTPPLDAMGRGRAIESVVDVLVALVAGRSPGLLVVDDADWADDSTVEVLAFLARRLAGRPVGIAVAWRPLASDDADRRGLVAAAQRERRLTAVVLGRLGREDVARLSMAALGAVADRAFVDRLFADSEGLPLYVSEVLAAGDASRADVPHTILELLRGRIARVGDVAAQVLAAASVVGRSFDFETVRAASGRSAEETVVGLEELVRRGLVREVETVNGDVRLDFTHGRLRDVAYDSLGLTRRRLLHGRVADALRAGSSPDALSRWSRIAHHEAEAGRQGEAAGAHVRAAHHARAVFANREAREHLEAALALGATPTSALHEALGEVLTLLGDYRSAIAHLEAAAATAEPSQASRIERSLALVHARLGDWARAESHISDALGLASDDPPFRAALLADRSAIAARLGDEAAATAAGREALAIAEASDDSGGIALACHVLGVLARGRGAPDEASALLERSLAASSALPDPSLRIGSLNTLALVKSASGDRQSAIDLLQEALQLCARQGDRHRQAALENNLADVLRADGRREEAMDHLKRAVAIFAEIGGSPGTLEPEIWKLVEW